MTDRTAQILEAAIQEFINNGEPVSSGLLYDRYEFGIKPAMIRLELDALEEGGYLEQPYHSAGRIPTNHGYEFFADRMLDIKTPDARENELKELFERQAWPDFLEELSSRLGLLSIAADFSREMVYKTGLDQLIDHLDWEDQAGIRSVIHDFKDVDERLSRSGASVGPGPKVFIGKKSPLTRSESLSVIGGNYKVGDVAISIFTIGPKRMDYRRTIRILKGLWI